MTASGKGKLHPLPPMAGPPRANGMPADESGYMAGEAVLDEDQAVQLGALDQESRRVNEMVAARQAATLSGEDKRKIVWGGEDSSKYDEVVATWGNIGALECYIKRVIPTTHDHGSVSIPAVDTWGKFVAYVHEHFWDGNAATFTWALKTGSQQRATGKLQLGLDLVQKAKCDHARRLQLAQYVESPPEKPAQAVLAAQPVTAASPPGTAPGWPGYPPGYAIPPGYMPIAQQPAPAPAPAPAPPPPPQASYAGQHQSPEMQWLISQSQRTGEVLRDIVQYLNKRDNALPAPQPVQAAAPVPVPAPATPTTAVVPPGWKLIPVAPPVPLPEPYAPPGWQLVPIHPAPMATIPQPAPPAPTPAPEAAGLEGAFNMMAKIVESTSKIRGFAGALGMVDGEQARQNAVNAAAAAAASPAAVAAAAAAAGDGPAPLPSFMPIPGDLGLQAAVMPDGTLAPFNHFMNVMGNAGAFQNLIGKAKDGAVQILKTRNDEIARTLELEAKAIELARQRKALETPAQPSLPQASSLPGWTAPAPHPVQPVQPDQPVSASPTPSQPVSTSMFGAMAHMQPPSG